MSNTHNVAGNMLASAYWLLFLYFVYQSSDLFLLQIYQSKALPADQGDNCRVLQVVILNLHLGTVQAVKKALSRPQIKDHR